MQIPPCWQGSRVSQASVVLAVIMLRKLCNRQWKETLTYRRISKRVGISRDRKPTTNRYRESLYTKRTLKICGEKAESSFSSRKKKFPLRDCNCFLFFIFHFFLANVPLPIRIGTRVCLCVLLIIDILQLVSDAREFQGLTNGYGEFLHEKNAGNMRWENGILFSLQKKIKFSFKRL